MNSIRIRTSGWHYKHWKGLFYPHDISDKDMLAYYREHFDTAEINNTFYQLPDKKTFIQWREKVPANFVFAVKASRYITHMKKLKDPKETLVKFFSHIQALEEQIGPILFQLPPRWNFNAGRLKHFVDELPQGYRYAFEFRDKSWLNENVYEVLREHNMALCIYDYAGYVSPKEATADFIYIRLHGPDGAYRGKYSQNELSGWAGAISVWAKQGKTIYCYFNNDQEGYAPQNASQLLDMVS